MTEDDDSHVNGTEDRELVSLFEQTAFALQECPKKYVSRRKRYIMKHSVSRQGIRIVIWMARVAACMPNFMQSWRRLTLSGCGRP